MELLPDAGQWRSAVEDIFQTYRAEGVFAAMGRFGALVQEGGPKYNEERQQAPADARKRGDDGPDGGGLRAVHRPREKLHEVLQEG